MTPDITQALRVSLQSGNARDCEEFIRLAQPIIASGVLRALRPSGFPDRDRVDDLIQDTFAKLYDKNAQALRGFQSDQPEALAAWLKKVASSVALDSIRSSLAKKHGSGQPEKHLDEPGLSLTSREDTFDSVELSLFVQRIRRCLESEKVRDRSIFWLYHLQEFTAKEIAAIQSMQLGIKGVETAVLRVTHAVRECMGRDNSRRAAAGEGNS